MRTWPPLLIDFDNARPGTGTTLNLSARLNPTDHLDIGIVENQRWVNVDAGASGSGRLFLARVSRLRSTYTFTARLFIRGIAQYVSTDRAPALYTDEVAHEGTLSGQLLLSYKLNWQSVVFVGSASSLYMMVAGSSCGVSEPRA